MQQKVTGEAEVYNISCLIIYKYVRIFVTVLQGTFTAHSMSMLTWLIACGNKERRLNMEELKAQPRNMTTLCYIEKDGEYLMLHRVLKKNDVNKDKWIGIGGHFEYGESPEECLLREVREETGLTLLHYNFRGLITFISDDYQPEYMCLYTADEFEGEMISCNEGILEWVPKNKIRELNLWEGDKIFFRLLDENAPFFSLKLCYINNVLKEACLDGRELELFDILLPDMTPSGRTGERGTIHESGDWHATSHIWVVRRKSGLKFDVLLQKRSSRKDSFPGSYDISSAGHVNAGDTCLPTALRELKEELGITAQPEDLTFIGIHDAEYKGSFYNRTFHNCEHSAVYVYDSPVADDSLSLQPEEVESVIWMDYDECLDRLKDGSLDHCIFLDEFLMLGNEYRKIIKAASIPV